MAKTGTASSLGTAEGAVLGRTMHALHAEAPVLADSWAIHLLPPALRELARDPSFAETGLARAGFDPRPVLAVNLGALRFAEDQVERAVREGIAQYVVLGAGFDSFALRREDMKGRLRVFEVDHPDVQALKRERVAEAAATPAAIPEFVPVDFESARISDALGASRYSQDARSIFSWMNTLPYLTVDAIADTLADIARLTAPGSRLVANYTPDVPFTEAQARYHESVAAAAGASQEPFRNQLAPAEFATLLGRAGFAVLEELDEAGLTQRYFDGRSDGLAPGLPARVVVAERRS